MRYPVLLLILCLCVLIALPLKERDRDKRQTVVSQLMSADQQARGMAWVDDRVHDLRALPPLHQALAMTTAIILIISVAVIVAYVVNSLAMILGIGIAILAVSPLLLLAALGIKPARRALQRHLKKHPEFGPMHGRISTRLWQRRYRRAAREQGFVSQY